ncbi:MULTISPECIES: hypothetical protein [unclassified Kitasatospora]|uniref:hypothetical protein n=1 Tax=unclassified Kitasatospora TaxID=2633591 RepID=UPI0033E05B8B
MKADQFTMSAGSTEDSPGLRRGFIPRADGTEAMREWLVETGRAVEDADIAYLEVRGWIPEQ